jgi:hypothetical protein
MAMKRTAVMLAIITAAPIAAAAGDRCEGDGHMKARHRVISYRVSAAELRLLKTVAKDMYGESLTS